nr:NAD-dependent deacylase [Propionivibrio limicola]
MNVEDMVADIAVELRTARRVLFITGAGVSADSGLPTYRGVGGLYNGSETEDGLTIEDALSGECFATRPDITWKYLARIERNCRQIEPNAAHRAIAALEKGRQVVVLTQNIDGLHTLAGSTNVIEIHGTLGRRHCTRCGKAADARQAVGAAGFPVCPVCGGVVRPEVVLFGESLPNGALQRLYEESATGFDMVFVIGTSAVFPYIAEPVMRAVRNGVPTVEINPAGTRLSDHVRFHLPLGAAEALVAITRKPGESC